MHEFYAKLIAECAQIKNGVNILWIIKIGANYDINESYLGSNSCAGWLEEFSHIHRKISVRWVCEIVSLKQPSETVFLMIYRLVQLWSTMYAATVHHGRRKMSYVWYIRFFANQTSENIWLHLFNNISFAERWWLSKYSQTLRKVYGLVQVALLTKTDVFCLVLSHVCSIHWFLTAARLRSQYPPFFIWMDGKWRKILNFLKSILLVFYLLLYLLLLLFFESVRVRQLQNGFRIENTGTDNFRCGVDSAQYKTV